LIAAKSSEWRNATHRAQWLSTLTNDAAALRGRYVDDIETTDILEVLKPLWTKKPETAARLRGRIEAVLDAAKAQGLRSGENPARWKGNLAHLLPRRQKIAKSHFPAMPYRDVPALVEKLRTVDSAPALAAELCILTAARRGEVLGASWSEIDMEARVWTIPATRMKAGKEHRIPLSSRAIEILERMADRRVNDFVFASDRSRGAIAISSMLSLLRRMGVEGATPHGFRSAFRDWCGSETHFPREIAEEALAHSVGNAVERAYRRTDALEKRRLLMESWERYCAGACGKVVKLRNCADKRKVSFQNRYKL
jgi:integrase